jgi:hypothetical protein
MIIKTYKQVYDKVAEQLGIDRKIVEKVGDYTWNDLNNIVDNFKRRDVYVSKLGCFRLRKKKVESYISKNAKFMIPLAVLTNDEIKMRMSVNTWYSKAVSMQRLLDEWNKIAEEKREFKRKRDESIARNIQKPLEDLGGVKEQSIQG